MPSRIKDANTGQVTIDAGGDAGSTVDETIKKASETPLVVAVDFFDPKIFSQNQSRLTAPVFNSSGQTQARVIATGDHGLVWQREHSAPIGAALEFHEQGGAGGGACGSGALSSAQFRASVIPQTPTSPQEGQASQPFEFATDGVLTGGLSRGPSPFCNPVEGTVHAEISFQTQIQTIVRSDNASILSVQPPLGLINTIVEVFDWEGHKVAEKSRTADGAFQFALSGPGVYRTQVSGLRALTAHGAAETPINDRSRFALTVR